MLQAALRSGRRQIFTRPALDGLRLARDYLSQAALPARAERHGSAGCWWNRLVFSSGLQRLRVQPPGDPSGCMRHQAPRSCMGAQETARPACSGPGSASNPRNQDGHWRPQPEWSRPDAGWHQTSAGWSHRAVSSHPVASKGTSGPTWVVWSSFCCSPVCARCRLGTFRGNPFESEMGYRRSGRAVRTTPGCARVVR